MGCVLCEHESERVCWFPLSFPVFVFAVLVQVGGKALAEAMSLNTSVTECDVRLTDVDEQSASCINKVVWANQCRECKQISQQRKTGNLYSP